MTKPCNRKLLWAGLLLYTAALSAQDAAVSFAPEEAQGGAKPAAATNETADLAKATQNPVASLISVPFQNNSNFAVGPYNRTQDVLNVQPVIPIRLNEKWMMISRTIQPIVWQPAATANAGGQYGFGDMNPTLFLSPAKPGKLIWGFGPAIVLPTATSTALGQGKLSFGPSAVALVQPGHWTIYNLKKGWNINTGPIITANWRSKGSGEASTGNDTTGGSVWTVPFGGGVGRVMRLGYQPVNLSLNFYGNAVHPPGASSWGMRIQIALLYPKRPKA